MGTLALVIKREFLSKIRNKAFIVMTFVSPLIFLGISLFIGFISNYKSEAEVIAVHDETGWFTDAFPSDNEYEFVNQDTSSIEQINKAIEEKVYDGAVIIKKMPSLKDYENDGVEYISESSQSLGFINKVENKISKILTDKNRAAAGIDTAALEKTAIDVNMALQKTSGEATVRGLNEIKIAIGSVFGYFIMMFIIIYGNMVMRSVIEEKTNRIVEIIVSSVKPRTLMYGKIIGTTLAAVLQFVIWIVVAVIIYFGLSLFMQVDLNPQDLDRVAQSANDGFNLPLYINEIMTLPLFSLFFWFILFFVGGYFLYSSIYAAIGAAVDNETDSQQFMLPIITPLMLAVYIGFFTVVKEPHGTVATVFSFIPLTSPIVMLMRIPFGVPLYQIILSFVLLLATFLLIVWVASKIYRIGILMYGKKPSWKEMLKWLKY